MCFPSEIGQIGNFLQKYIRKNTIRYKNADITFLNTKSFIETIVQINIGGKVKFKSLTMFILYPKHYNNYRKA